MELEYPESYCKLSPVKAHRYLKLVGNIWRCHYCWRAVWLPANWDDAIDFSNQIRRRGLDRAYKMMLSDKPDIMQLLDKLEKIRLMRKVVPEDELMKIIAVIVTNKEKEEVDEGNLYFREIQSQVGR